MTDNRLDSASQCVRVLGELLEPGELARLTVDLSVPETISFTAQLTRGDQLELTLYSESDDPLDAARTAFNWLQDYLAENGETRGQARPACPAGHAHPAICQEQDGGLYLVCPADPGTVRRIL
ncbi:MAG: hypothetical protein JO144_12865 [Actinobacteria bacterium]|nr:hypothetical protein [Actinomycetota bacterium]